MYGIHSKQLSARQIFTAALSLSDPTQLQSYLRDACGDNPVLRQKVELLLKAHMGQTGNPLDAFADAFGSSQTRDGTVIGETPQMDIANQPLIGPYKLLEQIGEGGMGAVYMAEQKEPVRRLVALKVIKPGMDTQQVIARFEAERQALAMMNHPHIAKVLDAGATAAGRPYFVMELVKGVPLTEFCDQQQLDTRQRLRLFITLCQAVQHAHQKGLIHRDLKPSNVLVEMHDVTPVLKVIDFGVAKAIGQQLTEKTLHTGFSQVVGTPLYMSPEQAGQSSIDVDTRSDVYTLGVLLYEILTGHTPFESETLRNAGFDEMRRMIREVDPPRPSVRVSTLQANALSTISDRRKVEPHKLSAQLRGELDWIVMKSLEKDRNRRYESASAFVADVQRYLNDEPVEACPPSASYRLRKYARRNKVVLTTSGLIAVALVLGTAISIWQAVDATSARRQADQQRQRAEASFEKALEAVDRMLTRVGDDSLRDVPQMELVRQKILRDAVEYYRGFLAERPDHAALRYQTAVVFTRLGDIYEHLGQGKERDAAFLEARRMLEELHAEAPNDVRYRAELANAFNRLGFHTGTTSKECESFFRRAIALLQPIVDTLPADTEVRRENVSILLANSYRCRGVHLTILGRLEEAEQAFRTTIALCEKAPAWGQNVLACCHGDLASLHETRGRHANAIEASEQAIAVREAVVKTNPQSAFNRFNLGLDWFRCGNYLVKANRLQGAEHAYRQAMDLVKRLTEEFPSTQHYKWLVRSVRVALVRVSFQLGQKEEAGRLIDELAPSNVQDYLHRAVLYETVGSLDRARANLEQAISSGAASSEVRYQHALFCLATADQPAYRRACAEALNQFGKTQELDEMICTAWTCALAPNAVDDYAPVLELARRAVKLRPNDQWALQVLGATLSRAGQFEEAQQHLTAASESPYTGATSPAPSGTCSR